MRPLRLIILLSCFVILPLVLTITSVLSAYANRGLPASERASSRPSRLRALFSFGSPSSLFPPSAIISLTDDNTTFFVARPAAFGPLLPSHGLSGPLWIGSGFGEERKQKGGAAIGAEGELGCSDIPGWIEGTLRLGAGSGQKPPTNPATKGKGRHETSPQRKKGDARKQNEDYISESQSDGPITPEFASSGSKDDGTDDHLTESVVKSSPASHAPQAAGKEPAHADIQSLQESAEINGKIVLLSRGGCGFLEKVKWAQRRGGIALIVGDDTRGGGLVTMYARGDTRNVTIPSLFTSYTTAHLLSSLIPSEKGKSPRIRFGKNKKLTGGHLKTSGAHKNPSKKEKASNDKPVFTTTKGDAKQIPTPRSTTKPVSDKKKTGASPPESPFMKQDHRGFFHSLLSIFGLGTDDSLLSGDDHRPPSSGQLEWTVVDEWEEEGAPEPPKKSTGGSDKGTTHNPTKERDDDKVQATEPKGSDDFVIGVHDWRDPDLVGALPTKTGATGVGEAKKPKATKINNSAGSKAGTTGDEDRSEIHKPLAHTKGNDHFKGGSITPGSGEYHEQGSEPESSERLPQSHDPSKSPPKTAQKSEEGGWLGSIPFFHKSSNHGQSATEADTNVDAISPEVWEEEQLDLYDEEHDDANPEHDGLWVTLTPTSMSSSPFFDTLLVLVISPLVTLSVVYALLLLRSRIRRRRWRAPKSIVERLPVRTYHTIPSSSASSTRNSSSQTTSPTAPLLLSGSSRNQSTNQPRPRSRTTSGIASLLSSSQNLDSTSPREPRAVLDNSEDEEKGNTKWRRPYSGKQVECVVCLEEYVDGVSKVMSLPCGHEFHVDCITPWLTTRRRTCPICKGDVVRSMNSSGSQRSGSRSQGMFSSARDEDIQTQAAETTNESPLAAIPIARIDSDDEPDLEPSASDFNLGASVRNRLRRIGAAGLSGIRGISAAAFGDDNRRRRSNEERERERLIDSERRDEAEEHRRR